MFANIDFNKKQTLICLDYYKDVWIKIYKYIYGGLGMLKVFCFAWKQKKNLKREKKNPSLHIPRSLKPTFTVWSGKKYLRRFQQQKYKESKPNVKTDEKELWRIWLIMTKLALRCYQTMQPNFVSRTISAPLPTLLLWSGGILRRILACNGWKASYIPLAQS